jgi:hypothetical protein
VSKATADQILAAAQQELSVIIKRLRACRNRLYRETGTYPDDLGAAIERGEFLLRDLMAGLITPYEAKRQTPKAEPPEVPPVVQ